MEPEIIRFEDVIKGCIAKWKTILVFSILTAILGLALAFVFKGSTTYEGIFKVLINPINSEQEYKEESEDKLIQNYVVLIKTNKFIKEALEKASIDEDYNTVISRLDVSNVLNTDFLDIRYKGIEAEDTSEVLNAIKIHLNDTVEEYNDAEITASEDIEIVETISKPSKILFGAGGFLGGLFAALGLTFVLECINNTFRTKGELERETRKRVIGNIPHINLNHKSNKKYYEFYNQLAVNLSLDKELRNKAITITSSVNNEGVSETAFNVAKALSKFNKVILLDGNFNKPSLSLRFKDSDSKATLDNYLLDKVELDEIIKVNDELEYISVNKIDNYSELFAKDKMDKFLELLKEKYDYVIIDSSAVKLSGASKVLAEKSDATILVVRAEYVKKNSVKEVINELESLNINLIGLVFNYGDVFRNKYEVY